MKYKDKIFNSLGLFNLSCGIDECSVYGPFCIFFALFYLILFVFKIISSLTFISSFVIITYIFFVYFPFHKNKKFTIFSILFFAGVLYVLGYCLLFTGKVTFFEIKYLSFLWIASILIGQIIIFYTANKRSLEEADDFMSFFRNLFGNWILPILVILAIGAFSWIASTYYLFGNEHIYLWAPVFFLFIVSGIRLIYYKILKNSKSHTE